MADYPFDLVYQDGNLFLITPNPTWGEFTGSVATMAKIDKEVAYDFSFTGTETLPPELEFINTGTAQNPVYSARQINQYGADNDVTCLWTDNIEADWSSYIPAFKVNEAQIKVTEFGDLTIVDVSSAYDRTYQAIETRGVILANGSFSQNDEYLWYAVQDGSLFYCVAFKEGFWRAFRTAIDPSTLQDGDLTGNQVVATVTSSTEFINGLRRAETGTKVSYAPDGGGYAHFENGITSFSDDFFVGKNELFLEMDLITINTLSGNQNLFYIRQTDNFRFIRAQLRGKAIRVQIKFDDGSTKNSEYDLPTFDSGQKRKIGIGFKNYDATTQTNGFINYYVDGILENTIVLNKSLDTSLWSEMLFISQDLIAFKNFQFQDKIKYNGANYTPVSVLPPNPFIPVKYDALEAIYDQVGNAQGLFTLMETNNEDVKYSLSGKWYDGFNWVTSNTIQESNTITEIIANAATFPQDDNIQLSIHYYSETNQGTAQALTYVLVGQGYASSVAFTPVMPFLPPDQWISAIAGITTPGTNTFVTFVMYNGATRQWYDPAQQSWVVSNATFLQSNTIEQLNEHLSKLEPTGQWYPIAILTSLDEVATGFQNPEPPSISFLRIFGDVEFNPTPPPLQCIVYYFQQSPCGDKDNAVFRFKSDRSFMHGNWLIREGNCDITPDDIFSLGDKAMVETATLNVNATSVSEKYMYSMWLVEERKETFRGICEEKEVEIFLGYVEIPAQANITLDELWDQRIFERPANGTATDEMLLKASQDYPIPV